MDAFGSNGKFTSTSQRVASTYIRLMTKFCPVVQPDITMEQQAEVTASQTDLHAFFYAMYEAIYSAPAAFGMPITEDIFLLADHAKDGPNKTDVKRVLDRVRKHMDEGLEFLFGVGIDGLLDDQALMLETNSPALSFIKKKNGRAWVEGLASAGLVLIEEDKKIRLLNAKFPAMMQALQSLAHACAGCDQPGLGKVFFARCDFKALMQDFTVDALDLYRMFPKEDYGRAMELHAFFTEWQYQPLVNIERMYSWEVKYQGKKSIKSTPLFQIDFDERLLRQMRTHIKCASSPRIVPLLPNFSEPLQEDFSNRVNLCFDCHWCDNKKTLGPTDYVYKDKTRKICWYVNSDIPDLSREAVDFIKEYALMHEELEK